MKSGLAITVAILAVAGGVGCSSETGSSDLRNEVLPAGTAQLTINGQHMGTSEAVQCAPDQHLTMIKIGDEPSGAIAMVSAADELTVEWVRIHDLNGFSGNYGRGLGGKAQATLTESTYHISGTATGFNTRNPSLPATEKFAIRVSC